MAANPQQTGSEDLQPASADIAKDKDQQETREWMDALSAVIESEGPERAHFLLEQLLEHAREKSIDMPFSATTAARNKKTANKGPKVTNLSCLDGVCLRHQRRHQPSANWVAGNCAALCAGVDVVLCIWMVSL